MKNPGIGKNRHTGLVRWLAVLLIFSLVGAFSGCQAADPWLKRMLTGEQTTAESTAPDDTTEMTETTIETTLLSGEQTVIEQEGVRFVITVDRPSYQSGDIIRVHVQITNTTGKAIPWQAPTSTFGPSGSLSLYVILDGSQAFYLMQDGKQPAVTDDMLYGELAPGESISREAAFKTSFSVGNGTTLEAWDGSHSLTVTFARGQDEYNPLTATVPVRIVSSSPKIIDPKVLVDQVRLDAAFTTWFGLHSGESVARQIGETYEVNYGGTWEKATEDLYHQILDQANYPEVSFEFADGSWIIRFFSKLGNPPDEIRFAVDASSGEILSSSP
jgi:hypothetical protein